MAENTAGERLRVLLVDDEEEYVNVLAKRLARRGIDSIKTYSGSQGLQALRWKEFDAAVLDLKLGDMDGIEVLKICKKIDPGLPVIILTGHGSARAAQEGLEQGAFDYLSKPCELEELAQKIICAAGKDHA